MAQKTTKHTKPNFIGYRISIVADGVYATGAQMDALKAFLREKLGTTNGVDVPGVIFDPPRYKAGSDYTAEGTIWLPEFPDESEE